MVTVGQMEKAEKYDDVGKRQRKEQEEQRHGNGNKYGYCSGESTMIIQGS